MPKSKVRFVGLDVHKDSIAIAVAEEGRDAARDVGTIPSDWAALEKTLTRLAGGHRLRICYEAGPTGFALHRRLKEAGYDCQVVAPSLIPQKPGQRVKTDRRDAANLARCLRAGDLTAVSVPEADVEALRDLERARAAAKTAETTAKHQLGKFLLRNGRVWDGGSNWTRTHMAWIRQQAFSHEAHRRVLRDYLKSLEDATERVARLTKDIEELVEQSVLAPLVVALQSLRGVATISSVVIAAEIGDLKRFSSAAKFMAFVGLVPSEYSTGPKTQRGSITKTGNRHVRRILVEAAWHYFKPAQMSQALRRRNALVSDEVRKIAWKAQKRLHRKFHHLVYEKGKPPQVAVIAVARELAGFIWAIGQEPKVLA
jgi:transposase